MATSINSSEYTPILGSFTQTIEHSVEDDVKITISGLQKCPRQEVLFRIFSVSFLFIPYILIYWYPNLRKYRYKKSRLDLAEFIFVTDNFGQSTIIPLKYTNCYINNIYSHVSFFEFQHTRYIWSEEVQSFYSLKDYGKKSTLNDFLNSIHGLKDDQQIELLKIYGPNKITIEVKSYWTLFISEVFHPFYVFQTFSVILWSLDEYYYYAGCIVILSVLSIVTSLRETRKQSVALHDLAESSQGHDITIQGESGETKVTPVTSLVPGDLIVVPANGFIMPCDALLLTGNCIVNESSLTGESVPVTKTFPHHSDELYIPSIHKRHTLFAGTRVIQTRYYDSAKVVAKVVRTGFETAKGELVKSILYPKPMGFKFYRDSMRFVMFLFVTAMIGMSYCIYIYVIRKASIEMILLRTLDIITIIVPPALPAAMTAGTVYSQNRLKALNIFCISPPRINVAGKLKLVCFDKTGTLTEDGLNFHAVVPVTNNKFVDPVQDIETLDQKLPVVQTLASCHSLTRLNGEINGDPLDLNMFENTKWMFREAGPECTRYGTLGATYVCPANEDIDIPVDFTEDTKLPYQIGIVRQFPFSSNQQCMSVICNILGERRMILYTKGAPEKVVKMCDQQSIPENFHDVLNKYAIKGFRIIALAFRKLDSKINWIEVQKIDRTKIENDLEFLGLLVMQNSLKHKTTSIIRDLHNAQIRTVMITGDNIMTAVSVSRDCCMVLPNEHIVLLKTINNDSNIPKLQFELLGSQNESMGLSNEFDLSTVLRLSDFHYHFALDGHTWTAIRTYYKHLIPKIILKGTVFARFTPEQKTQLVKNLQELDYIVGMVGDGANDCGALKAAHIGISLSQAEASVAAPFTSKEANICCVKAIALEGRCALVTSFAIFKYMALYSFVQFFSVLILYTRSSMLGNMEFLYIDLVITTVLAISMSRQEPASKLVPKRPMGSLISVSNIIPLLMQTAVCAMIQLASLYYLLLQEWYVPIPDTSISLGNENVVCWDNTIIFTVSCFQYLILALIYSKGKPFRKDVISNGFLIFSLLGLLSFCTLLLIYPFESLANFFELIPRTNNVQQNKFRDSLIVFPITNFIIAVFIEVFIADRIWFKKFVHIVKCKRHPKNKFKIISQQLHHSQGWFSTDTSFDPSGENC